MTLKPKLLYLNELYISEKIISLAFKQAWCELCSMYRTNDMIPFSGGCSSKNKIFMIFSSLHACGKMLQECYLLWSLRAHQ
jgi:hypothetical protein